MRKWFLFLMICMLSKPGWSQGGGEELLQEQYEDRALQLQQIVRQGNRYVSALSEDMLIDLPVGISRVIGNMEYLIIVDSISFTPQGAFITAYLSIKTPQGQVLHFRGTDIRFTREGGLSGEGILHLITDKQIRLGPEMGLELVGDETFVKWDCEGFKSISLAGVLMLSRKLVVPENEEGLPTGGQVTALVRAEILDWSDLLLEIELSSFQLPALPGFSFRPDRIYLDMSDLATPATVDFPANYSGISRLGRELWMGLYMETLEVLMPAFIKNSDERVAIKAQNLLIDEQGVSLAVEGKNLLAFNQGEITGWNCSVDELQLTLMRNRIQRASMRGMVGLPVMEEDEGIQYLASLRAGEYFTFSLENTQSLAFPAIGATEVSLSEGSVIDLLVNDEGRASLLTSLNGAVTLSPGSDEDIRFEGLRFESLELSSVSPFILGGTFSLGDETHHRIGNFPASLTDIGFSTDQDNVNLGLGFRVGFTSEEEGGFSAQGKGVIAINTAQPDHWKLEKFTLENASLAIDGGAFRISGEVAYFNQDPEYGKGYQGEVEAWFAPGVELAAEVMFGRKSSFSYWYVDALAVIPGGAPIVPGLAFYGFSGGAYSRMRPVYNMENQQEVRVVYTPDERQGLGIRAGVTIGTHPSPRALIADAALEMSFNRYGGLQSFQIKGTADFMKVPDLPSVNEFGLKSNSLMAGSYQPDRGQVSADLLMFYDAGLHTFHANLEVRVDVGGGTLSGAGPENLAGAAVMHFSPTDWYIKVGEPYNRVGLQFGFDDLAVNADAYFMTGTQIPGSPPPPDIISAILNMNDLDYMRDFNALGEGEGFALGASLDFSTGRKEVLIFYGEFNAGVGFDLMLKNYGESVYCSGSEIPLGINGWYANGQAYGYFQGAIGLVLDLPFAKGEYKILDIGAAVLLQARMPNPFWMKGVVGGYYDILNGLVRGECRFSLEIGSQCDLQSTDMLSGLKIISDVTPAADSKQVSVFATPRAVFNLPVGREFELTDLEGNSTWYRISLDYFDIKRAGIPVSGTIRFNDENDVAAFESEDIFAADTEFSLEMGISFQQRSGSIWRPVTEKGEPVREEIHRTFYTGEAPDHIPVDNIAFSYPIIDQSNFHPGISSQGYIVLHKGQPDLLGNGDLTVRFVDESARYESEATYNDRRITFTLPDQLTTLSTYQWGLTKQRSTGADIDADISEQYVASTGNAEIRERSAGIILESGKDQVLVASTLKTSRFLHFEDKMAAFETAGLFILPSARWNVKRLLMRFTSPEGFENEELAGLDKALVRFRAVRQNNQYLNELVYPLVYAGYPLDGDIVIDWRDTDKLGLVPLKAVNPLAGNDIYWDLIPYMYSDYQDIQQKVVERYLDEDAINDRMRQIIGSSFPFITWGNFDIEAGYYMPGEDSPVESRTIPVYLPETY